MSAAETRSFLSPLTLGTVQLGLTYGVANQTRQPDQETATRLLDAAVEGGIHSFDTAPSYGSSEEVLGRYFAGKPVPSLISKWTLSEEPGKPALRRQIYDTLENSAAKLGLIRVPAMLLHTPLILASRGAEVTGLLQECVQAGLVDKVGVSLANHVDQEFEAIWPFLQDDLYELVQIPFNVLDQRLIRTGALEKLRQSGKLVLARSAYLQGLIFLEDDRLPDPLKQAAPWLAKLRRLAERERMSMAELAFAYVRDTPGITSVLVGAETPEQVRSNVDLLKAKPVSEQTRAEIEKEFLHVPDSIIVPTLWNLWKNTSK